jgi:tetratricopeptide (TPR) repeat protein
VHDVDPQLDRAIMQATEPDPRNRPVSAAAVADMLRPVAPAAKRTRTAPWLAGAALIGVAAVAAALSSLFLTRGRVALTSQDTIVLADFDNTTGEPVFDRALKVALAVALEQSPFLKVFPDDRVRETLRLMQRAPDEPVVRSLARDVARRERLKALVSGSIGKLGANYVIALEAINAETGDVMALEQVEAPAQEEVLTALGAASARLRENLGESLASIEKFGVPLPQATTASLEALHAYALALDQGRVIPRVEAIPHLQRAIELDPDFALALALLSGVYANTGRSAEAPVLSRRAFELRDRVSERERFFISWRYYLDATQDRENALDLAEAWTTTYPREAFAFNALGIASAAFGQHGRAVEAFREAIRLDDRFVPPYGNMTGSLMSLNRFEEARASLQEAAKHGISFITIERMTFLLAFIENRQAEMARELDRVRSSADAMWASAWEARTAAFSGQFRTAHARYRAGVQAALRDRVPELAAQWTMEDAEAHAIAGECAETRREVPEGLALGRDNFTLERASRALALCGDGGAMSPLTAELVKRFPDATLTMRIQLPVANAALALAHGDAARALERLDPVAPYDNAPAAEFWPAYLRGQAHFLAKEGKEAAAQFQAIVDRRGQAPTSPLYPLAHLGLARALALAGSPDAARAAYERFFTLWAGVEAGVRPAAEARREYARLK